MSTYDLTPELQVEEDGSIRIIRLNRPEQLNATNHELHRGLAELFPQIDADEDARAVVLTGNGRAFSAGGDFAYLDELSNDPRLRRERRRALPCPTPTS
jgi:enoyl-CoA hydratase